MPLPRFQVGDRVTSTNRSNPMYQEGVFVIRQAMPFDRNHGFSYRAESAFDKGLRVFQENELVGAK